MFGAFRGEIWNRPLELRAVDLWGSLRFWRLQNHLHLSEKSSRRNHNLSAQNNLPTSPRACRSTRFTNRMTHCSASAEEERNSVALSSRHPYSRARDKSGKYFVSSSFWGWSRYMR